MVHQRLNLSPLIVLYGITHVRIVLQDIRLLVPVLPKPCAIIVFGIQLVQWNLI